MSSMSSKRIIGARARIIGVANARRRLANARLDTWESDLLLLVRPTARYYAKRFRATMYNVYLAEFRVPLFFHRPRDSSSKDLSAVNKLRIRAKVSTKGSRMCVAQNFPKLEAQCCRVNLFPTILRPTCSSRESYRNARERSPRLIKSRSETRSIARY